MALAVERAVTARVDVVEVARDDLEMAFDGMRARVRWYARRRLPIPPDVAGAYNRIADALALPDADDTARVRAGWDQPAPPPRARKPQTRTR